MANSTWVVIETMPEHLRQSHTDAGNWGRYPDNGAVRQAVPRSEADALVAADAYAHIVGEAGTPGLELGADIPFPAGTTFTVRRPGYAAWAADLEHYSRALTERDFANRLCPGHIIFATLPDGATL